MSRFIHFKDVDISRPDTWRGKSILTLDIDWASDEELLISIDLLEKANVKACFFVTHHTPLLDRLRNNKNFELGIHPNFNPLILAQSMDKNAKEIIHELLKIVPEANVLRSHSMTTSGRWLNLYKEAGLKYLSNYIMYGVSPIVPFHQINGLIEIPVYFADDGFVYLNDTKELQNINPEKIIKPESNGLNVYNFHPIHIFLNSVSLQDYTDYKSRKAASKISDSKLGMRYLFSRLISEL